MSGNRPLHAAKRTKKDEFYTQLSDIERELRHHAKRHEELILYRKYTPRDYPKYDNYNAINVNRTADIPLDYDGAMGVPITFLDKHNPNQFELLGATESEGKGFSNGLWFPESGIAQPVIRDKRIYKRLFIRRHKRVQP